MSRIVAKLRDPDAARAGAPQVLGSSLARRPSWGLTPIAPPDGALETDPCGTPWLDGRGTRDIVEREQGVLP